MKLSTALLSLLTVPLLLSALATSPTPVSSGRLPLRPVDDFIGRAATRPLRHVFTSQREYRAWFGHELVGFDFDREWLAYCSLGPTAGDVQVSILSARLTDADARLEITTRRTSPGADCPSLPVISSPYAFAALPRPLAVERVAFASSDLVVDCAP